MNPLLQTQRSTPTAKSSALSLLPQSFSTASHLHAGASSQTRQAVCLERGQKEFLPKARFARWTCHSVTCKLVKTSYRPPALLAEAPSRFAAVFPVLRAAPGQKAAPRGRFVLQRGKDRCSESKSSCCCQPAGAKPGVFAAGTCCSPQSRLGFPALFSHSPLPWEKGRQEGPFPLGIQGGRRMPGHPQGSGKGHTERSLWTLRHPLTARCP